MNTSRYVNASSRRRYALYPGADLSFSGTNAMGNQQNQKTEPISGVSSEGYTGKGMVQSKPRKGGLPKDDDE